MAETKEMKRVKDINGKYIFITKEEYRQKINAESKAKKQAERDSFAETNKAVMGDKYPDPKTGISTFDKRVYKQCFVFENPTLNERVYVMNMTGLSTKQIFILQIETGLKPFPEVTPLEAGITVKQAKKLINCR